MTPRPVGSKLLSWGTDVDDATHEQAGRAARMPFVDGHVALMPDAHVGKGALLDEHPDSYKDIDQVMADQSDLVEVVHTLRQVLNYKGT